ncbi:uncharacterized protein LOC126603827 isoform X6 [Malus sylvestris]|uniref:uncharacterized protein LOC126603827 isoform X6 n=1 Tax=Malus sylvestris TaxID=3752 RepID=UPI0010A9E807|nr:uncharacterized protein LOC103441832 isoform X3 [Malus domestica]XP_050126760.1 uncharacterized protein LOC126603827 isoform X6 [Malus sylvestris]
MARVVGQLLSNRNNPCRGLLHHLKQQQRPCNFIQTQTLISARLSSPESTPSTKESPFNIYNLHEFAKEIVYGRPLHPPTVRGLSAVFYMTGRRRPKRKLVDSVLINFSGQFPHVTIYEMVLPKDYIGRTIGPFHFTTLPMFFFYERGEMVDEVVGADVVGLRDTLAYHYGWEESEDIVTIGSGSTIAKTTTKVYEDEK